MLRWNDVRRQITRVVGPRLSELGFQNPGRAMWRYRPSFVDVVAFESRRQGCFQLAFGCGLRRFVRNHPTPWHCQFSTNPAYAFRWGDVRWDFCNSEADQSEFLKELTPRIVHAAEIWFEHFATVDSAINSLLENQWSGPQNVADCAPGSAMYDRLMAELLSLKAAEQTGGT